MPKKHSLLKWFKSKIIDFFAKYHSKEEAIKAVTKDGLKLEYCTLELKNNEEVVMPAIKEKIWAFEYASDELKSNKTFIMKALHEGLPPNELICYSNLNSDIEIALTIVAKNGYNLEFCTSGLKNNEEVVMAAIKQNSWTFQYASDELKSNKTFILNALHEGVDPCGLIANSNINIKSDLEVMTLVVEKSENGVEFQFAKEEAAINKELAAKALVKWGAKWGASDLGLWENLSPTVQEFFPKDCWHEKAQLYLHQIEQNLKQAEMVTGGCNEEDEVVW